MQDLCRICYNPTPEPLISPCLCKGSVAYIHRLCLTNWLKIRFPARVKMLLQQRNSKLRGLKCEVCKSEYAGCVRLLGLRLAIQKLFRSDASLYFLLNLPILLFITYKLKYYSLHLLRTSTREYLEALYSPKYRILRFLFAHLKVTASFTRLCVFSCAVPVLFKSCFNLLVAMYNECLDIEIIDQPKTGCISTETVKCQADLS